MQNVKTQKLTTDLQNLFIELVNINLSSFEKVSFNMLSNTIKFYSELTPFNTVSENYLITLCNNKGIKIKQ